MQFSPVSSSLIDEIFSALYFQTLLIYADPLMRFLHLLTVICVVEVPPKLREHRSLQHFAETQEED
jgi:hypothetical protein